ncbi:tubulin epsilon chain-like isoform X1 [Neodiprion virginianus]|uniref:tubulin epsilon chain-like isoform X1 n=2 Tax=Neodiprion virginianus TaxID=2961670 RepID=UPI001EE6FBFC|nr:tubulin epsilon chain-like isoform X1 [Neodiprion virginianus]
MSQFISVQVGQCGNQIGSAFWPLVLNEYGIQTSSNSVQLLKTQKDHVKNTRELSEAFHSFFHVPGNKGDLSFKTLADLNAAKVKARTVLIDMEDSVVSRYRQGPLRGLFDQTCSVTNYPGSGNNWAVGHYTHGTEYRDRIDETVRRVAERCDCLHGFMITNSVGGGTGSGLGTAVLSFLEDSHPRVDRFVSCVFPSGTEDVVTAPYNVLLASRELLEHATCVFPVENKALLEICNAQMSKRENIDQASYNGSCLPFQDMNSIIVNMLLHLTSGSRFPGSLNMDMNELATNLVTYPKLNYIFSSVSPIALTASTMPTIPGTKMQDQLFTDAWSRSNQLLKTDPLSPGSVILSAAHVVRGTTSLTDMRRNIKKFQSKARFTIWSKEAMKVGLCSVPPFGHPASLLCLLNSTAMSNMLEVIVQQFDKLYSRKAHAHHYLEVNGFEENHFHESREAILNLSKQYIELQIQQPMNIPRLQLL